MRPYMNLKGKGGLFYLFGDKPLKKFRRVFKKSARVKILKQDIETD